MAEGLASLDVTAEAGVESQSTNLILANVQNVNFDFGRQILEVRQINPTVLKEFELSTISTITWTPATNTVVLSN